MFLFNTQHILNVTMKKSSENNINRIINIWGKCGNSYLMYMLAFSLFLQQVTLETLVHAPKFCAEEISKFSILIGHWENNRRGPSFKTARKYINKRNG